MVLLDKMLAHVVDKPREIRAAIPKGVTQIREIAWSREPHQGDDKSHCSIWFDAVRPLCSVDLESYNKDLKLVLSEPRLLECVGIIPIVKTLRSSSIPIRRRCDSPHRALATATAMKQHHGDSSMHSEGIVMKGY